MCRLGQQQGSLFCPFDLPVRYHRGDLFEHVHYVQVSLSGTVDADDEVDVDEDCTTWYRVNLY